MLKYDPLLTLCHVYSTGGHECQMTSAGMFVCLLPPQHIQLQSHEQSPTTPVDPLPQHLRTLSVNGFEIEDNTAKGRAEYIYS